MDRKIHTVKLASNPGDSTYLAGLESRRQHFRLRKQAQLSGSIGHGPTKYADISYRAVWYDFYLGFALVAGRVWIETSSALSLQHAECRMASEGPHCGRRLA